jgi:hypothetical protein
MQRHFYTDFSKYFPLLNDTNFRKCLEFRASLDCADLSTYRFTVLDVLT